MGMNHVRKEQVNPKQLYEVFFGQSIHTEILKNKLLVGQI
jgi:hypothetical protein